jgi:hypothetical protein
MQENFTAILSICGTLGGAIVVFLGTLFKEHLSRKWEFKYKRLEWQKEYQEQQLANPIITFIDEMLQLMDDVYWTVMEGKQPEILDSLVEHRKKEGMIKARVAAFGDDELSRAFDKLSHKYGLFRNRIYDGKVSEAYDEMKEARQIAGAIFARMQPKVPRR